MNEIQMKKDIMSRVTAIYWIRRIVHPLRLKFALFCIGLIAMSSMVSVQNIFNNLLNSFSPNRLGAYLLDALTHTEVAVQVALAVTVVAAAWILLDLIKNKNESEIFFSGNN